MSKTIDQKIDETLTALEGKVSELEGKKPVTRTVRRTSINLLPAGLIMGILWGMGIIVAKGFLATMASIFIPFIGPAISIMWLIEKFTGVQ